MRVPAMPELVAPLPLAAVVLLAVNDHLLKARWPGALTGKLSDLAGCFVLPLFLSAALALLTRWAPRVRLSAAAVATASFFAALKLSPAVAAAVARALAAVLLPLGVRGGEIVADPSDLVALPLVVGAWGYGVRAYARAEGARGAEDDGA